MVQKFSTTSERIAQICLQYLPLLASLHDDDTFNMGISRRARTAARPMMIIILIFSPALLSSLKVEPSKNGSPRVFFPYLPSFYGSFCSCCSYLQMLLSSCPNKHWKKVDWAVLGGKQPPLLPCHQLPPSALRTHLKKHSGEKPIWIPSKADFCNSQFHQNRE